MPESRTDTRRSRRVDIIVVSVVGTVSLALCAFYFWAASASESAASGSPQPPIAYAIWGALTLAQTGMLWWHRRRPVLVFAVVFTLFLVSSILIGDAGTGASLPLWFALFALTLYSRPRFSLPIAAAAWATNVAAQVTLYQLLGFGSPTVQETVLVASNRGFFYAACIALGFVVRVQQQRARDAAERAELVQRHSEAQLDAAVALERNRMARELHDLAAHQLVDVLMTARAARFAPSPGEPDERDEALAEIVTKASQALTSVRAVVGALRESDSTVEASDSLETSVYRVIRSFETRSRSRVDARIGPNLGGIGVAGERAVVSILTEALVNAEKHAPGASVTVELGRSDADRSVRLETSNPLGKNPAVVAAQNSSGYGLIGAGERATIVGGTFSAGASHDGCWRVQLDLPASGSTHQEVPR